MHTQKSYRHEKLEKGGIIDAIIDRRLFDTSNASFSVVFVVTAFYCGEKRYCPMRKNVFGMI